MARALNMWDSSDTPGIRIWTMALKRHLELGFPQPVDSDEACNGNRIFYIMIFAPNLDESKAVS